MSLEAEGELAKKRLAASDEEVAKACSSDKKLHDDLMRGRSEMELVQKQLQKAESDVGRLQAELDQCQSDLMLEREASKSKLEVAHHEKSKAEEQIAHLKHQFAALSPMQQELERWKSVAQDLELQTSMYICLLFAMCIWIRLVHSTLFVPL